jgi:urease accessory protein
MTTTSEPATREGALYRLLAWLSPAFPVGGFSYSHGLEAAVEAGTVRDRATLERWVAAVLTHGSGRIDADLFREAWGIASHLRFGPLPPAGEGAGEGCRPTTRLLSVGREPSPRPSPAGGRGPVVCGGDLAALLALSARAEAHRGTAELALESGAQGAAFLATCRAAWGHPVLDAWAASLEADGRKPAYAVAVGVAASLAGVPLAAALTAYLHAVAANLVSAGLRLIPLGQTDGQRCLAALEPVVHAAVAASLARDPEDFGACAIAVDLLSIAHETQYTRLFRS